MSERLRIVPVDLKSARDFVLIHHRHHAPPIGHKFSVGVAERDRQVAEKAWDEGFAHSVRTNFHSRMPRLEDNPYRKEKDSE